MENTTLLRPTLHVEVLLNSAVSAEVSQQVAHDIRISIVEKYDSLQVSQEIDGYEDTQYASFIDACTIADFTGPRSRTEVYLVKEARLDIQPYSLRSIHESGVPRRRISQPGVADDDVTQARILPLPNVTLTGEWESLVYDDGLPARLLRYLTRMLGVMRQPTLNLSTFNWNRLVLLHGPPGSGKSTLCRALAQKLSIRLSASFSQAVLVEVNTNAMLSKYFGESGKLIGSLFEKINGLARSPTTLVCVVIDEVETIASSRKKATDSGECSDGLRATNQLLTALDKIRHLPNIIILCTSNLISAMDSAFLDRVDIKQLIPCPSTAASYNIFRSCLNELVRTGVVRTPVETSTASIRKKRPPPSSPSMPTKRRTSNRIRLKEPSPILLTASSPPLLQDTASSSTMRASPVETSSSSLRMRSSSMAKRMPSSTENSLPPDVSSPIQSTAKSLIEEGQEQPTIPTHLHLRVLYADKPQSYGGRVWKLAEKCTGFSGRTLRRLPILGLAMYTWGGECSLHDAISALESAVEQELKVKSGLGNDQKRDESDVVLRAFDG